MQRKIYCWVTVFRDCCALRPFLRLSSVTHMFHSVLHILLAGFLFSAWNLLPFCFSKKGGLLFSYDSARVIHLQVIKKLVF